MSDSRTRSHDTIDIEVDPASRNVRARLSPLPGDPYQAGPSNVGAQSDSNEEPFEDEEPMEEEEVSSSAHGGLPSPLPPTSPPTPIAPPSPAMPPSPAAPPVPVLPSLRFATRNVGVLLRWDWMPTILRWWRQAEQLPVIPLPADDAPRPALTQEPVHHTLPVIIARLRTHDEQLEDIERAMESPIPHVEHLQQQVAGVESELTELRDIVVDTHTRAVEGQEEVHALRQEVIALRQELAAMRAERDRLRADASSSAA